MTHPRPMATVPKDGTMVWLLISILEDDDCSIRLPADNNPAWTIGFNHFDHNDQDVWNVVGWDWCTDEFKDLCNTDNGFKLLGWYPCLVPTLPRALKP